MIGRLTGCLEPWPRRWLFRLMGGCPDVDTRQKWTALWPYLSRLPSSELTILDAGCGRGRWALELAARRPRWRVIGVDRVAAYLAEAGSARRRLGLFNVAFVCADFERLPIRSQFDVVLSVSSAHYLARSGRGATLFTYFRSCLCPGGQLLALLPRRRHEAPFVHWLPRPAWHPVFSACDLRALCRGAGLEVQVLRGTVGPAGVLAKQLGRWRGLHPVLLAGVYPLERLVNLLDRPDRSTHDSRTLMWTLVARPCHG
jgi:SAM-dependent methyltransferase